MQREELMRKLGEKFNKIADEIDSENGEECEFNLNNKEYVIVSKKYFETAKHIMIDAALDLIDELQLNK